MKVDAILILWRRFRADRRGNIAMIAALSILGLVGSAGLGIDYYNALAAKTRLDLASDAAAIAAINAAQSYIEANSATQTDPALSTAAEAAGQAQAQRYSIRTRDPPPKSRPRQQSRCRGLGRRSTRPLPIKPLRRMHSDLFSE